jgi:4-hydroxy-tetrahydrodipicolinate synthase
MNWKGVFPAITTPFNADLAVDEAALTVHCRWLIENGCTGIVCGGSLGEAQTLSFEEKIALVRTCVAAVGKRVPVVCGIASLSTTEAVALAEAAEEAGAKGLMVLPPYVYVSDWREMKTHVGAVIAATKLPCLLYNNPPAYRTDFLPEQIAELAAEFPNLDAVKESSGDVRRVSAIKALVGRRLDVLVGMDDAMVSTRGRWAGLPDWRTPFRRSRSRCSISPAGETRPAQPPSISGSCRCCGWIPCPNSSSSSSGCRPPWGEGCRMSVHRACLWPGPTWTTSGPF